MSTAGTAQRTARGHRGQTTQMGAFDLVPRNDPSKVLINDLVSLLKFSPTAVEERAPFLLLPAHPARLFRKPSFIPTPPAPSHYIGFPPKHSDHHMLRWSAPGPLTSTQPTATTQQTARTTIAPIGRMTQKEKFELPSDTGLTKTVTFGVTTLAPLRTSPLEETTDLGPEVFYLFVR